MYYDINLKKTKNICFLVILIIVLAICVNIVLYVGLVCADSNGCRRQWCKYDWFNSDYKALLDSHADKCKGYR